MADTFLPIVQQQAVAVIVVAAGFANEGVCPSALRQGHGVLPQPVISLSEVIHLCLSIDELTQVYTFLTARPVYPKGWKSCWKTLFPRSRNCGRMKETVS